MPRKTSAKTASNAAMSAVERSKLTRAHQYSSSTVLGTPSVTSVASRIVWSGETATPASRSASLKRASSVALSAGMCAALVEARLSTGAVLSLSKGSGRMLAELVEARPSKGSGRMFDRQPGCPGEPLVFDVLQYRAERSVHGGRIDCAHAEQLERGNPVDGLGDARPFLQVQSS